MRVALFVIGQRGVDLLERGVLGTKARWQTELRGTQDGPVPERVGSHNFQLNVIKLSRQMQI